MSKSKLHSNGVAVMAAPAVGEGVDRLMAVIDDAVNNLSTRGERQLVRDGVAAVVRDTLVELAEEQANARALAAPRAIGDAAEAGMNVAKQVQNLGFVEFTTGLVNGVFDTVVAATIRQMDAYAKLIADLSKTLAEFQAENVSDAQINAHLAERYPDGAGGTVVRSDFTFQATPAANGETEKAAAAKLQEVVKALISETSGLKPGVRLTREDKSLNTAENDTAIKFVDAQIAKVRPAIGALLAQGMMDHLRAMAREGMARIVVTNGEIMTKLTFRVTSTEVDNRTRSNYTRSAAGAHIRGRAGFAFWGASAGASWNRVSVSTVNESNFDSLTMSTEIIGQVKINFKTETFPPATVEERG